MEEGLLIGEVCRLAECTPRTVRHYETKGLLTAAGTTQGNRKLYGKETVSIIRAARLFKLLGYSLKEIRQIIALTKSNHTEERWLAARLRKMLSEAVSKMDSELELMAASRKKIADLIEGTEKCDACGAPDCRPCGKLNSLRALGLLEQ